MQSNLVFVMPASKGKAGRNFGCIDDMFLINPVPAQKGRYQNEAPCAKLVLQNGDCKRVL